MKPYDAFKFNKNNGAKKINWPNVQENNKNQEQSPEI